MASASLSSRPPLSHGLSSHRRGTLGSLPSFSRDPFSSVVDDPATSPLFTVSPDEPSRGKDIGGGGLSRDPESLSRLSRDSRFLSASVFDKSESRNGVSPHRGPAPNLHLKRHSLGHVLSGSLLPGSEPSATGGSLLDSLHSAKPAISPGDVPKRIGIRRSSHVFLSDGEAHSPPAPPSPHKGDDDSDSVFVPDSADKKPALLANVSASSFSASRGGSSRQGESRPVAESAVQGREAVSVTTASCSPVDQCVDEDELLDLVSSSAFSFGLLSVFPSLGRHSFVFLIHSSEG